MLSAMHHNPTPHLTTHLSHPPLTFGSRIDRLILQTEGVQEERGGANPVRRRQDATPGNCFSPLKARRVPGTAQLLVGAIS